MAITSHLDQRLRVALANHGAAKEARELLNVLDRDTFTAFDDFIYQTLTEADTPWVLNSGSDIEALDPAVATTQQAGGVLVLTTGDVGSGAAADGSQIVLDMPVQADSGGLIFETRLHINTAITDIEVACGFTDSQSLEAVGSVSAADVTSSAADDAVLFIYDTAAATDQWFAHGEDSTTLGTGVGATGVAPVAATYQVLRIEVDTDGNAKFFINDVLEKTVTSAVSPDVSLYATVYANATTTTSKTVDVDYIFVQHTR